MNNDVLLVPINIEQPNVEAQSDFVVYVPQAHKNKPGIVKEGDGINIENGVVSLNKQTVEDMIDANKWVSYGFEQNLTEDEKGMARHNIGAGDNDFTGSWFDLANRPQETVDFAEAERQKSKNLFDKNAVLVGYELVGNTGETNPLSEYWVSDYIKIQGMANLYVSGENRSAGQSFCYYDENKTYISTEKISGGVGLLTPLSSAVYLRCNGLLTQLDGVQIEEGTVATSYQPYNGAIVHETYPAVEFAETERQKTLNLFNPKNNNRMNSLPSINTIVDDNLIRVSTDGVHGYTRVEYLALDLTQHAGKRLYFKCNYSASSTNDTQVSFWLATSLDANKTELGNTGIVFGSGSLNTSFVVPNNLSNGKYLIIMFYSTCAILNRVGGYVDFSDIMLSTKDVPYQPYNGAITHNNDAPVIFAESERQKSKNLFKINSNAGSRVTKNGVTMTVNDDYTITLNGTATATSWFDLFRNIDYSADWGIYNPIKITEGGPCTFLFETISGGAFISGNGYVFGASIRKSSGSGVVGDQLMEVYYNPLNTENYTTKTGITELNNGNIAIRSGATFDNLTLGIMVCEGVDTKYQPYSGEIVHVGSDGIRFSEIESRRSKNLFNINKLDFGTFANVSIDYAAGVITTYQSANDTGSIRVKDFTDLEAGKKYTLLFKTTSSNNYMYLNGTKSYWHNGTTQLITQEDLEAGMHMYGPLEGSATISEIQMIEYVDQISDDSYQPYSGKMVHGKDIIGVEHVDVVYDMSSNVASQNLGYRTGLMGDVTVDNLDLSKYKRLKIYTIFSGASIGIGEIDLKKSVYYQEQKYALSMYVGPEGNTMDFYFVRVVVNLNKTSLTVPRIGYYTSNGTWNARHGDTSYHIYKIEGVY